MRGSQESLTTVVVKDAANWPTATATNRVRNEETLAKCAAFRKRNANQNTVPLYLEEVVLREQQHGQAAPGNPSTSGSRPESWATATVSTGAHRQRDGSMIPKLDSQVGGKLNPRWVETLMGLPVGWVMPSCKSPVTIEPTNSDSSATESFPPPQSELFAF
jgi:hypothetical protein